MKKHQLSNRLRSRTRHRYQMYKVSLSGKLKAICKSSFMVEEPTSEWLSKELTINEINAIVSIQKIARGYLQRRILLARTPNSDKNIQTQQALTNTMNTLKIDSTKAAGLLFR